MVSMLDQGMDWQRLPSDKSGMIATAIKRSRGFHS